MTPRDKQNELITQALKRIWMSDDGKVLDKLLRKKCHVENTSVCVSNPNAQQTAFNEGMRKVYLDIMWYINEGYIKKEEENDV
ncbi:hypothetical protein LCGC14_0659790 [marine sediment metagenome]|uniref:Bbp19-like phage domain-containing protein n=1 Tax=marine sediment metagenome TaxID=412755 RepID=A0A0F9QTW1_9ZZZZ